MWIERLSLEEYLGIYFKTGLLSQTNLWRILRVVFWCIASYLFWVGVGYYRKYYSRTGTTSPSYCIRWFSGVQRALADVGLENWLSGDYVDDSIQCREGVGQYGVFPLWLQSARSRTVPEWPSREGTSSFSFRGFARAFDLNYDRRGQRSSMILVGLGVVNWSQLGRIVCIWLVARPDKMANLYKR